MHSYLDVEIWAVPSRDALLAVAVEQTSSQATSDLCVAIAAGRILWGAIVATSGGLSDRKSDRHPVVPVPLFRGSAGETELDGI